MQLTVASGAESSECEPGMEQVESWMDSSSGPDSDPSVLGVKIGGIFLRVAMAVAVGATCSHLRGKEA